MPTRSRAFRSILCPVDLSAASRAAVRTAGVVADHFDARLTVLFVDDPLLSQAAQRFDEDRITRRTETELTRFVERTIGARPKCSYEIVNGDPATEILKAARRARADLIVMGTQGRRGPKRLFFGSTAGSVVKRTTLPVLVVPPSGNRVESR